MSKTPKYDAKISAILSDLAPVDKVDPLTGETWHMDQNYIDRCRKWNVPPSKYAPFTRMRIIASWGSGPDLWYKPHFETEKPMLSCTGPDTLVPVVPDKEYWSKNYGIEAATDYDVSQPFFDQLAQVVSQVPIGSSLAYNSENCIGNGFSNCVNTFIVCGTYNATDSWYVLRSKVVERCTDAVFLEQCEDSFSCSMSVRINNCQQVFDSIDCFNSAFLFDCRNCENCFCSTNLRRKSYVFMNEQLTKDEYEKRMAEVNLSCNSTFQKYKEEFHRIIKEQAFWPENFNVNSSDCEGDYLIDCVRSSGYFATANTDVTDVWFSFNNEKCETVVIGNDSQDVYHICVALACQNTKFSYVPARCLNVEYCIRCNDCEDCFGCVGLQHKKFHIFNKEYSEEEYWQRLDELKCAMLDRGEYGEWFPNALNPQHPEYSFGSIVAPLSRQELDKRGIKPFDPKHTMRYAPYVKEDIKDAQDAPDCIQDVGEEWVGVQFYDQDEDRQYTINKAELEHRQKRGYPFPLEHFRGRMKKLSNQVNCPERVKAVCSDCETEITVNKNRMFPERSIKCMDCYLKHLEQYG